MRNTTALPSRVDHRSMHRSAENIVARGLLFAGGGLMLSLSATAQVAHSPMIIEKPAKGCGITYLEHESGLCIHLDALTDDKAQMNQLIEEFRAGLTRKGEDLHRETAKVKLDRASLAKLGPTGMEFRCQANRLRLRKLEASAETGATPDPEQLSVIQAKVEKYCATTSTTH